MSTNTNLSTIDLSVNVTDGREYYNNYVPTSIDISSAVDTSIVSAFERITGDKDSAKSLASAVIYTSKEQGLDPMVTLDEFLKLTPGQLDAYLCAFLNQSRVGTSYLGIRTSPATNKYVTRSIIKK